jgi:chemotaxis protein CheD
MAHIVLPQSSGGAKDEYATKYADIAVPRLIEDMVKNGASKARLIIKLVGGAQMIQSVEFSDILEMGSRNLEMTKKALASYGVGITASETGGNSGRSVWMLVDSGKVMVRKAGEGAREL